MTARRVPRWSEVRPLIGVDLPLAGGRDGRRARRLARCASIDDLREEARRRTPRAVFDYTDGAAGDESSLSRAREEYARVEFQPRVLRDVSSVDLGRDLLGRRSALPFAFAPTGFTRLMGHEGEPAVARVAQRAGIPMTLSTLGTTSIEDLATAAPGARRWFQLYVMRQDGSSADLVERAAASGFDTIVLTVDTPVGGLRRRDVRNGLTIPPRLTASTLLDMSRHPAWWANLLTTEPLQFANLRSTEGTVAELIGRVFDPSITFADVTWLRERWTGSLVVKGVQSVEDSVALADLGVDGIVLSTHGGRQLDRAPVPLELLPRVVDAVGDRIEVLIDGGIRSGEDVVAAVALGARGVLVGRPFLYGLMAGGEAGVQRVVDILTQEIRTTLQLLGVAAVDDLGPDHVRMR